MASPQVRVPHSIRFGEGYELDLRSRRLRRGKRLVKLERIPLELLVLLVERSDEIVARDEIVSRVWGEGVFFDSDNSIRGAIRKLRQALRDDADSPRFIQTVTGRGYRFIASVTVSEEENPSTAPDPEPSAVSMDGRNRASEFDPRLPIPGQRPFEEQPERAPGLARTGEIRRGSRDGLARRRLFAGALALLVSAAITGYILIRTSRAHSQGSKITSLAVLPLTNLSGDPAQQYFADGMTEEVIGRLSMIRELRVISRTSVMQFRNKQTSLPEIAKMLHVDGIVEGSVMREGDHVRVHAQLINAATDQHIWSESYDRELSDTLALESEVAQSIARRVEVTVTGDERARLAGAREVAPDVYESYLKGRGAIARTDRRAEIEKSVAYFQEAIRRDPTFAPAYVGLASAYNKLGLVVVGAMPPGEARNKTVSAARKALELDPDIPEAHAQLAFVHMERWQWSEAEAEYRRALELNPNDASAYSGFGGGWLMLQGRMDEALSMSHRAVELDPLGEASSDLGWVLFHARRYDDAIRELRSVIAVHPDDSNARSILGQVLICTGQSQEAIPLLDRVVSMTDRSPGSIAWLAVAYARAGRRTEAVRLLDELKQRQKTNYVPPAVFVYLYLELSENDQAFAWLERSYQEQSNIMMFLRAGPFFDPVRNDPRFKDLLRRVGLD